MIYIDLKKKMNSTKDIIATREKYGLNQSDYSLVLGLGKVTIHRYENGMLQTEANDSIITPSKDIQNMKKLLEINWNKISEETYKLLYERLSNLELLENHRILKNIPLYTEKNVLRQSLSLTLLENFYGLLMNFN